MESFFYQRLFNIFTILMAIKESYIVLAIGMSLIWEMIKKSNGILCPRISRNILPQDYLR